jgi:hypothetical protein
MPRARREPLRALSAEEMQVLAWTVQVRDERRDRVARATALLAVARGHTYAQAAREAGWRTHVAVAKLVRRFNAHGLGALDIAAGRGRRPLHHQASPAQTAVVVGQSDDYPADQRDGTAPLPVLPRPISTCTGRHLPSGTASGGSPA